MRTCADSVTPANLPEGYDLYAGYANGRYENVAAIRARFPGVPVISISVLASANVGDCLDVEAGDATPAQAPGWVAMRREAGQVSPIVYCSESAWPSVKSAFAQSKVAPPQYWVAAYPGEGATIPAGAIGHQYRDAGPYDQSVFVDYIPGVDGPLPPTNPTIEGNEMIIVTPTGAGYWVVKPDGSVYAYGDAEYLGGVNPGTPNPLPAGHTITGAASHPTSQGYWLTSDFGGVYAFGASKYMGSPNA